MSCKSTLFVQESHGPCPKLGQMKVQYGLRGRGVEITVLAQCQQETISAAADRASPVQELLAHPLPEN